MKMTLVTLVAVWAILASAFNAHATDIRPYLAVHGGATSNNNGAFSTNDIVSYDTGFVVGGAAGFDFDLLRIEANVDFHKSDVQKFNGVSANGDLQVISYMINAHLVPPLNYPIKPYLVAGAGLATARLDDGTYSESNTTFAYQVGGGIGFEANRNISIDLGYRYLDASDYEFVSTKLSYAAHNFLLGLRYSF